MTNKQYENGEYLNIHNATKEQLKFMVKDLSLIHILGNYERAVFKWRI